MLWKTHIRIANEILSRLGMPKSGMEADRLREGSVVPDKWGDYPHHHGKSGEIRKYIMQARWHFLNGDMANACFNLGVALHYIQDYYTSLSSRSSHHTRWEQQIEEAYFVEDLQELVRSAFRDRKGRRTEYMERISSLSEDVEGKGDTLWLATLPGPGLSFGSVRIHGRPNVDLNFSFRASLVIAKSVFGEKTSPKLEAQLCQVLSEHEAKLKDAEITSANKILELTKKRDELKRRKEDGILRTLKGFFSRLVGKIYDVRTQAKFKGYEQQKHLQRVARAYRKVRGELLAPHLAWYKIDVPEIDINIVRKELLSAREAAQHFGVSESVIKDLIRKGKISNYSMRDKELIRRSDLKEILESLTRKC